MPRVRLVVALATAIVTLCGCATIQRMFGSDEAERQAAKLQELQLRVMRFADEYVGGIGEPIRVLEATSSDPLLRLAAQNWKVTQSTSAYTIASGPSPVANALDLVVLASLSRMVMEDDWVSEKFGEAAIPLRDAHRRLEPRAHEVVKDILTPAQLDQLQQLIDEWRAKNPHVRNVAYVHFNDFAKAMGRPAPGEAAKSGNLFSMLGLDPLSNLDPAVRELSQTRQLAERTIYYAQRVPNLIDMQVERLSYEFATTPETKRMLLNVDRATAAADAAGRVASQLPEIVAREREAAIKQLMDGVFVETAQTRELVAELRSTLEAGTATSDSLNRTLGSFDQLLARFGRPRASTPPGAAPARPFDITEYTAAATELARTASELERLVAGLDRGSPRLAQAVERTASSLQAVVDHAYWRLLQLIVLLLAGALAVALVYRRITRHWWA